MGIKDLLKFTKPYIKSIHIKKYAGKRVGIDAYSWLHKGAYSCSMELCLNSDSDRKLRYLNYFMHRINLLKFHKITPVVVFDGASIPCKAVTDQDRCKKRKDNFDLAMEKLKEGNVNAASELFQRAVSVTPLMAHQLIQMLRSQHIEFVVAPYEADAQLAYLSSLEAEKGGIAAVITEDSDLLAYGCQATIFKMDQYGNGEEMLFDEIFKASDCKPSFQHFDKHLFTGMCVLAGCDFLPSVPGIGIVKAHSFILKYRNLDRVLSVLKLEKKSQMPVEYIKSYRQAVAVFQHARIYDPNTKMLKYMKPLAQDLVELLDGTNGMLDFLGPEIPPSVAIAIAEGNLNPVNMEAFDSLPSAKPFMIQNSSIQKSEATIKSRKNKRLAPDNASEKSVTGGFLVASPVVKQDAVSTERKYVNEAVALQKMILMPELPKTEKPTSSSDLPVKVPHNPFMIRKSKDAQLDQINCSPEQLSSVTEDEGTNVTCVTPDDIASKLFEGKISKKMKFDEAQLDHPESMTEQVPEVIDVEISDIVCVNKGSQESVKSMAKNIPKRNSRAGNVKSRKTKQSNLENKSSILKFFSRV